MPANSGWWAASSKRRASAWRSAAWKSFRTACSSVAWRLENRLRRCRTNALDGFDGQGAGHLAGPVAAHAVGDQEEVAPVAAVLRLRLRQAGLADPERAGQLGDQEVVLVGRADLAAVGEAEAPHGEGGGSIVGGGAGCPERCPEGRKRLGSWRVPSVTGERAVGHRGAAARPASTRPVLAETDRIAALVVADAGKVSAHDEQAAPDGRSRFSGASGSGTWRGSKPAPSSSTCAAIPLGPMWQRTTTGLPQSPPCPCLWALTIASSRERWTR